MIPGLDRLGLTDRTVAMQHDLVVMQAKAQPPRETVDRAFQVGIVKRNQPPAAIAHEMVMMIAARVHALVARRAVSDLETIDQPPFTEQFKDPVDTRSADPLVAAAQLVLDLKRRQGAPLPGEQIDDRVTRPPALVPSLAQHRPCVL